MLSRTAEYAVRAIVVLARHYGDRPVSGQDVAAILGAPRNYLSKTLQMLARRGLLTSVRGPGGGFSLARAPETISVADVADVFADERTNSARCLLDGSACDRTNPCSAHHRWSEITLGRRSPLLQTAIGELCGIENGKVENAAVQPGRRANRAGGRTHPKQESQS